MRIFPKKEEPVEVKPRRRWIIHFKDEYDVVTSVDNCDDEIEHYYYHQDDLVYRYKGDKSTKMIPEHRIVKVEVFDNNYFTNSLKG